MNSTSFLRFIAGNNCLILFEKAVPEGRLTLATPDGRSVGLHVRGFSNSMIEVPRQIFDDFREASLIEQDGSEEADGRIFFRLSADGRTRAAQ